MRLVVVGGSDAGIAAALRACAVDPSLDVHVLVADAYPNFSICGLPYWVGRDVADWRQLAHRTVGDLERAGIDLALGVHADALDPQAHELRCSAEHGVVTVPYDRLVVATGAEPIVPDLPGIGLPGVHVLHHMADAFALDRFLAEHRARSALIVGAGYIGLEMAEALRARGLDVTVVERLPEVLPTVDADLGQQVRAELTEHEVAVHVGTTVRALEEDDDGLRVVTDAGDQGIDVVLVCVGVRPNARLATEAGAVPGVGGTVRVDEHMLTSLPDVWAAGDCVHTHHRLLPEPGYLPLGSTAHKQGRVAGENAAGGDRRFAGSLGTQVVKVFDLAIARTGLGDEQASAAGFEPVTVASSADDHKRYYPSAHPLAMHWTADARTGRVLGCQLLGHRDGQVAKRIDVVATAIFAGLTIDEISDLDLSYAPPFGSPWDALQIGAQAWQNVVAPPLSIEHLPDQEHAAP